MLLVCARSMVQGAVSVTNILCGVNIYGTFMFRI